MTPLAELPPAYSAAFEAAAAAWPPPQRDLARAVLLWFFNTPPTNRVAPRRPGDEIEWRLISHEEWDRLRLELGVSWDQNDALMSAVWRLKDFHASAHALLPPEMRARLTPPTEQGV